MLLVRPSVPCRIQKDPGKLTGKHACVFVSYSANCTIKPHVRFHIAALAGQGFAVVLVVNVERFDDRQRLPKFDAAAGMMVRTNAGLDFGAWADAFRLMPTLWSAESVLLVNDSVFGPIGPLDRVLAAAAASPADVVGLTETFSGSRHYQSYFTLLKKGALLNEGVRKFWGSLTNLANKNEVIKRYEMEMLRRYTSYGVMCEALFPGNPALQIDPTLHTWREIVSHGFPYLKVSLVRYLFEKGEQSWRSVVADQELLATIDASLGIRTALRTS